MWYKMKILMLGWELPPYNSGGLGVACYHLAKALAAEGADIDFILPPSAQYDEPGFMNVLRPTSTTETYSFTPGHNPYTDDLITVRELQVEYERFVEEYVTVNKPAVVHANDWLTLGAGIRAKERTGVPLIAHVHATEFDRSGGSHGNPMIHEIEEQGLLMADHIVAVSNATKQTIIKRYGIPADKIEVIHNSSEAMVPHTTEMIQYRYIESLKSEGYIIVTTIGRLTVQKGLTYFLHAAAAAHKKYERFVFVICGDGEQRGELIQLSADLGIADSVLFTGFVRGKAWRDMYNLADVFVMSSVSEPFGLTALEAAQHDTAITLTRQSGASEVIRHTLNYDYWDVDRLADQLVNLALSPSLRQDLSENVRREVSLLSWKRVAEQFMNRYSTLKKVSA